MKVILTNWINLLGGLVCVFVFSVTRAFVAPQLSYNIFEATISALILVGGYGLMFWFLFIILLIILDLAIIVPFKDYLKIRLIIQWLIISIPFTYWVIKYHEWIFAVGIAAFFITQMLREKYIWKKKIATPFSHKDN